MSKCLVECSINKSKVKRIIVFLFHQQCGKVLGQYRGVCRDELFGGLDNNQMYTAVREDGISIVTYRRTLNSCKLAHKMEAKCRSGIIWDTLYRS